MNIFPFTQISLQSRKIILTHTNNVIPICAFYDFSRIAVSLEL